MAHGFEGPLHSYLGHPFSSFPTIVCTVDGGHPRSLFGHGTGLHSYLGHPFSSLPTNLRTVDGGHPRSFFGHGAGFFLPLPSTTKATKPRKMRQDKKRILLEGEGRSSPQGHF